MSSRWLTVVLCSLALIGVSLSLGCAEMFSAERNRRRSYVMKSDVDRIPDEIDWALGLDEPSTLYEDSFPPGP
jgi:hypothetical protein